MSLSQSPTIRTARLVLRPPRLDDRAAIFEGYAQDAEVTRYMIWRPHRDIAETEAFLREAVSKMERGESVPWAITLDGDDALVGMIELRVHGESADVGYVLARPFWGRGIMSEALSSVLAYALTLPGIRRVSAVCDAENRASSRVMEKAGMTYEGLVPRSLLHPNISDEPRDAHRYVLAAEGHAG